MKSMYILKILEMENLGHLNKMSVVTGIFKSVSHNSYDHKLPEDLWVK